MTAIVKFAALLSVTLTSLTIMGQTPPEEHQGGSPQKIAVHLKVKATNGKPLPSGAVDLKGLEDTCKNLSQSQTILSGEVTFQDVPVCTVRFDIVVTGFNVVRKKVDLRTYKDPLEFHITRDGTGDISMGPPTTENASTLPAASPHH